MASRILREMAEKRRRASIAMNLAHRNCAIENVPPVWPEMRLFRSPWEWLDWRRAKQRNGSALRLQSGEE